MTSVSKNYDTSVASESMIKHFQQSQKPQTQSHPYRKKRLPANNLQTDTSEHPSKEVSQVSDNNDTTNDFINMSSFGPSYKSKNLVKQE